MDKVFDFLMLFFVSVAMAGLTALVVMFTIAAAVLIWKAMRDE